MNRMAEASKGLSSCIFRIPFILFILSNVFSFGLELKQDGFVGSFV
jgi:hypothetical protein